MTQRCANGWPALGSTSPLLHLWTIKGASGTTRFRLRNGSVGFLLCHLALWFDSRLEDLVEPVFDDWSFAFRPIRGFGADGPLSNHAGYALDLNATDHPLGVPTRNTFSDDEIHAIRRRLELYDGMIDWGGEWSRADGMHFEIAPGTTMSKAEKVARKLLDSPRGKIVLEANPGQRAVILS